jgi:hypothetical protein
LWPAEQRGGKEGKIFSFPALAKNSAGEIMSFCTLRLTICCVVTLTVAATPCRSDTVPHPAGITDEHPWTVTFFNGVYTDRRFGKAVFNLPGSFEKNYLQGIALSRHLARFWHDCFAVEAEIMAARHHGRHRQGNQSYQEYVAALFLRYDRFPWNDRLHTSIALGEGLSLASKVPMREVQIRGNSQRLLNYLALELELTLPDHPRYSLTYRIHHRSGVFGLFGDVRGASDYYLLGLRCRF